MKTIRQACSLSLLLMSLSAVTLAGQISTTVVPQPTPPAIVAEGQITTGATEQPDTPGVAGDISTTAQASDSIVEVALSLVQSVLALF
jgi:hypothetical protein